MSDSDVYTIECINYVFVGIFILEAAIKLIAYGYRYFKESWNVFDFVILMISIIFIIAEMSADAGFGTTTA
jgi:uncharacterized protein YebE (UPF0316 family)